MADQLRVQLLGIPRIISEDSEVPISRRKVLGLLAYLAVHTSSVSREELATLLCPEQDQSRARNAFRQTLSHLKNLIGDNRLFVDRTTVRLIRGDRLWIDACEFSELVEQIADNATTDFDRPELCEKAVELYLGDFLSSFSLKKCPEYDDWMLSQQEAMRAQYEDVLGRLVASYRMENALDRATRYARRWVDANPFSKSANRELIELLFGNGNRAEANRQFERYRGTVRRELGEEPDGEMQALYRRITTGDGAETEDDQAIAKPPGNIHEQLTAFFGRRKELRQIAGMLKRDDVRLLTLTGPGGVGKTRLALQAARRLSNQFSDGVYFVDLSVLTDPDLVIHTILRVLDIPEPADTDRSLYQVLRSRLKNKRVLLILDNLEQIIEAGPEITRLLTEVPGLKTFVTSRTSLRVRGEWVVSINPLPSTGGSGVEAMDLDVVRLFADRAGLTDREFAITEANVCSIAEICALLDGLPLAIEIAATWLRSMTLVQLHEQLKTRFQLTMEGMHDMPDRQKTLNATFEWSYNLLSKRERKLFRNVAVFRGGFALEAVTELCRNLINTDTTTSLSVLVDGGLIQKRGVIGSPRYFLLQTTQQYASERLKESGEEHAAQNSHMDYYFELSETLFNDFSESDCIRALSVEHENVTAAFQWSLVKKPEIAWRILLAIHGYMVIKGLWIQLHSWIKLAGETEAKISDNIRADFKVMKGWVQALLLAGEVKDNLDLIHDSIRYFRDNHDQARLAGALCALGGTESGLGKYDDAILHIKESTAICEEMNRPELAAYAPRWLTEVYESLGDFESAEPCIKRVEELAGSDRWSLLNRIDFHKGILAIEKRDFSRAKRYLEQYTEFMRKRGDRGGAGEGLRYLGRIARMQGDAHESKRLITKGLTLMYEIGLSLILPELFEELASVENCLENGSKAAVLLGAAAALRERTRLVNPADRLWHEQTVEETMQSLGENDYGELFKEGYEMPAIRNVGPICRLTIDLISNISN